MSATRLATECQRRTAELAGIASALLLTLVQRAGELVGTTGAAVTVALLSPHRHAAEAVVAGSFRDHAECPHHPPPLRPMRSGMGAVQPMHQIVRHFMCHGVGEVILKIGREHPRIIANHTRLPQSLPAELPRRYSAEVKPYWNERKLALIQRGSLQNACMRTVNNALLLGGSEGHFVAVSDLFWLQDHVVLCGFGLPMREIELVTTTQCSAR